MQHEMKLHDGPYRLIEKGSKTVELRLWDEKRQLVKPGDTIRFTNTQTGEEMVCAVSSCVRFPDFEALYQHFDPISMGYLPGETADPKDMLAYYSQEKIDLYGALAIVLADAEEDV